MGLLTRWLAQALRLALPLMLALLAMQLPALAHQYEAALQQVAEAGRRDIAQRLAAARQFYPDAAGSDAQVMSTLQQREPANAKALHVSVVRTEALEDAHARVAGVAAVLRPIVAALDVTDDPTGEKQLVLQTTIATYSLQIELAGEALFYALAGLLVGAFAAEALCAGSGAAVRRFRRGGKVQPTLR